MIMRKLFPIFLFGLLLFFPSRNASADDMQMALLLIPPGEMLTRAYTPSLLDPGTADKEEEEDSYDYNVTFRKSWLFKSFTYKRIPTVTDPNKLAGFKAKADQNRYGTIETKWASVNDGIETAANFFAGSPLLLQPDYFVHLSILYGEPLPS
jgi:hypothetical protein